MKRTLLFIMAFLPMLASADAIEIDGIYYNLDSEAKTAEVTRDPTNIRVMSPFLNPSPTMTLFTA